MEQITQDKLDQVIIKHNEYLKGKSGGMRAVLKFCDMTGLDFRAADLSQADFSGSCLNDADLSHGTFCAASFFGCDLKRAKLIGGDFSRSDLRGAYIVGADLTQANFSHADMRKGVIMSYEGANTDGWNKDGQTVFAGSNIRNTNLSSVMAQGANFSNSNMSGILIHDANLKNANMNATNLSYADLTGSNIDGANLDDAVVNNINLTAVSGSQSSLSSMIEEQSSRRTISNDGTTIGQLVKEHVRWLDTAGKEGAQLNLSNYDLSHERELKNYPLTVIVAVESKFTGLYLKGVKMESSVLDKADFQDCDIRDSDFRGSTFKEARFTRADLSGANFSPLLVKRPDGSEITQKCDLSNAKMSFTCLDGANFKGAVLKGVDFSSASLKGCDFSNCDLTDAIFDNADLSEAKTNGTIGL